MSYLWLGLLFLGFARAVEQDLLTALSAQTSLTKFTSIISNCSSLLTAAQTGNKTVLAPNNVAFDRFYSSVTTATNFSTLDELETLLSYHFLEGLYSHLSILSTPQFIPTLLKNSSYTNVTTGQVVEAVSNNSIVVFDSAVNHVSQIVGPFYDIVIPGGVIHIIDEVLIPPLNAFETVTEAPLPYFIDLLGVIALNNQFTSVLQNLEVQPNMTFFALNFPADAPKSNDSDSAIESEGLINYYYIIPDLVLYSPLLINGSSFTTEAGVYLTITTFNDSIYVNDARITWRDILVFNGVLHVIDKVLNSSHPDARPQLNSSAPISNVSSASGPRLNSSVPISNISFASGHLSTGAEAGIGVGVAIGVLAIIGIIILVLKNRSRKHEPEKWPALGSVEFMPELGTQLAAGRQELSSKNYDVQELEARGRIQELDS